MLTGFDRMKSCLTLLLWMGMLGGSQLMAQPCPGPLETWPYPGPKPSFLELITGSHARPGRATWNALASHEGMNATSSLGSRASLMLRAGKAADALALVQPLLGTVPDDSSQGYAHASGEAMDLETGAMAALVQGDLDLARAFLGAAAQTGTASACRIHILQLLVSYLAQYGSHAPLFAHFNGGFYNHLQDSLHWNPTAPDGDGYLMALNVVGFVYGLDSQNPALYMELLGDLLSKEPNRFNANYLGALAYLRAGQLVGGDGAAVYERKAIFALEAPRQVEHRFNHYRFTQLKKALQGDVDAARLRQTALEGEEAQALQAGQDPLAHFNGTFTADLISSPFEETDPGQLAIILQKAKSQLMAREHEAKRYAGDVDLKKEVKKDARFNAFALVLILTILVAIVYIWRRLLKASKQR